MKWNNIPIPQGHSVGLLIGILIHIFFSRQLFQSSWIGYGIGLPLIIIGIGICGWSVAEAKEVNMENPNALLKSGPYSLSRNPMYVGWTLIYLGVGFAVNSIGIMILLPLVLVYIHFVDIPQEERWLDEQFGDEFRHYQEQVRRYF